MSKISELSDGGAIQSGDTLIAVRSGGNVKVTYGGTTTANIDGGTIDGTVIGGSSAAAGTFTSITGTSANINGTVTADGLTVDGSATIQSTSSPAISVIDTTNNAEARLQAFNSTATVGTQSNHSFSIETNDTNRALFSASGDISFYEDTGTTAKFFWDASAESLGIGTSSPSSVLHAKGGSITTPATASAFLTNATARLVVNHGNEYGAYIGYVNSSNDAVAIQSARSNGTTEPLSLNTFGGNVGIGTSSPSALLEVATPASGSAAVFNLKDNTADGFVVKQGSNEYISVDTTNAAEVITLGNTTTIADVIVPAGNVGIGETSPNSKLRVKDSDTTVATLESTGDNSFISFIDSGTGSRTHVQVGSEDNDMVFHTNDSEAMRIDSSGNVGIGTTPSAFDSNVRGVQVGQTAVLGSYASSGDYCFLGSNFYYSGVAWKYKTTDPATTYEQLNGVHVWSRAASGIADTTITWQESMRIDSSGNLLVGKTSAAYGTAGSILYPTGDAAFTRSGQTVGYFNRLTSDGEIVNLSKDGTTVGSIGNFSGASYLTVGNAAGLAMGTGGILPWNVASNISANGALDLGAGSQRFKDLYLSGGVYLGGTGAANKLDDYEEGTFTPVMDGVTGIAVANGYYTKVGNVVHVWILFTSNSTLSGTPSNTISGLPFTSGLSEKSANVSVSRMFGFGLTTTDYIAGVDVTSINFGYVNGDNNANNFTLSGGSTYRLTLSATYRV